MLKRLVIPAYLSVAVVGIGAGVAAQGCGGGEEETTICVAVEPKDGGPSAKCPNTADAGVCPPGCEAEVV
jgi:hypothetical protein